jgi:hypothetical protein
MLADVSDDEWTSGNDFLALFTHQLERAARQSRSNATPPQRDGYFRMEHRHDIAVAVVVDERDTTVHIELVTLPSAIVSHGRLDSIAQSPATSGMISRPKISSGSISCTFGMLKIAC